MLSAWGAAGLRHGRCYGRGDSWVGGSEAEGGAGGQEVGASVGVGACVRGSEGTTGGAQGPENE
jgi:hypothetical protein